MDKHPGTSRNTGNSWRGRRRVNPEMERNRNNNNRQNTIHNRGRKANNTVEKSRHVGFLFLQRLAEQNKNEILIQFNNNQNRFIEMLQGCFENPNIYYLILSLTSKVCDSDFDELKLQFLLAVCNTNFTKNLNNYIMELPFSRNREENSLYWNNQTKFWDNLITFLESIFKISPSTAMSRCRVLIEGTSKCCIYLLKENHTFELPDEDQLRLEKLRQYVTEYEQAQTLKKENVTAGEIIEYGEPTTSFRDLPIFPTEEDMTVRTPFLRPNIVNGAYSDVEHYLDVQFRLLREDCFGPIRDGIMQYINDSTRKKYDNIRLFRNVTFAEPYVSSTAFGTIVQVDAKTSNAFKKVNWVYNKRFLFGALILLSKDNCQNFIVATVLDREPTYLRQGKIPVAIVHSNTELDFDNKEKYIMIESDVYFEPYHHVLKVLKDPTFAADLPMKKYLVDVQPTSKVPKHFEGREDYLNTILASSETCFNESQFEAFKLALTHELAVIQGPPGTGKTYLGVKVAETLLKTLKTRGCLLLIICYTNHALDQFLEGILKETHSIVRIGGRSRMEKMKQLNLNWIRSNSESNSTKHMYYTKRNELKDKVRSLKQLQHNIFCLEQGIVKFHILKLVKISREMCQNIEKRYDTNKNCGVLEQWLFENVTYDWDKPFTISLDYIKQKLSETEEKKVEKDDYDRSIDDEDTDIKIEDLTDICDFTINKCYANLLRLHDDINKKQKLYEINTIRDNVIVLETKITIYKEMRTRWNNDEDKTNCQYSRDPTRMSIYSRWKLYFRWIDILKDELLKNVKVLQEEATTANTAYEEARMLHDLSLIQNKRVVGMTTTCAARIRKFIKELAPPIVIVEEAAEVLEQHIIASLQKHCQHLILIGDHQQLRPSAAHMELAKNYNIEVSLFERLINNNIHSRRLSVQHRMRPEIAALISPHIYPDLENHPSVETYANVRGVTKNVFFFTHEHPEEISGDSTSKFNSKEADIILRFANYILQQGYQPQDVTILSAYTAQMFYLKKGKQSYLHLRDVNITVVDNYQGEESKIIILSLVRNNLDNKIGFLGNANRICVALSRAKEGFYIFGNINMLKRQSKLWENICETLEEKNSVGEKLKLKCSFHPEQVTSITSDEDFDKVPEGGCLQKCNLNLSCSHTCPLVCHSYDRNHEKIQCIEKCERILCDLNHVCPLNCAVKCDQCKVIVNKCLPCGHNQDAMCFMEPNQVKCLVTITVKLPHCGHEAQKACYVNITSVLCPIPCEARLQCGHGCTRTCHANDREHEEFTCEKQCAKLKKGCTFASEEGNQDHKCQKKCYESCDECKVEVTKKRKSCTHSARIPCNVDVDATPCMNNCARLLPCNHHCKMKCHEPCGGCKQLVRKPLDCGHLVQVPCSADTTKERCTEKCKLLLKCGHPCPKKCGEPCVSQTCNVLSSRDVKGPCGHIVTLTCGLADLWENGITIEDEAILKLCNKPCDTMLGCDHPCKGSCSKCWQGRLHEPCSSKCEKEIICGHWCMEPCNMICPPCNRPCEVSCPHSKCKNQCGKPCVACKEECVRRCMHAQCNKLCSDPCSVPPCSEPCPLIQACGHPCRGLCGHPCPGVCKVCKPDEFPKDFLGEDYDDDAKLILVEECLHIFDVEELDSWMSSKSEIIGIKSCPKCRKPILKSYRYKDQINEIFKNDINPIKKKCYGTFKQIKVKQDDLVTKLATFLEEHKSIAVESSSWMKAFRVLEKHVTKNRTTSLITIEMNVIYLNVLELLSEKYEQYNILKTDILKKEFNNIITTLSEHLARNVRKISYQQQKDIQSELNRMHVTLQFSKLLRESGFASLRNKPSVANDYYDDARKAILGYNRFNLENGMDSLKLLQEELKATSVLSREEKNMIVQAIGLKAGRWFKCPNGHHYCIGECGGAMEIGTCPDCGAKIGGRSHVLLSDNTHDGEMDGSSFPAYSNENNILNYALN
ncbi:unnamed protein product [Leptosia nina]|uniref:RZ-type domain-containing protein n=1 Tax=Leptosia nina TaxID=320188 RepID=A0AAV1K7M8_9NEOP